MAENKQPVRAKKIPQRKCVGCGEKKLKKELIRVLRTPEGKIAIDRTGKMSGRGAYICPNVNCFKKAVKQRRIENSLEVKIPDEVYTALEKELAEND